MNKLTKYKVFDITDNKKRNVSLTLPNLKPGDEVCGFINKFPHKLKVLEVLKDDN